jgi:hypothetical protein
MSAIKKAMGLTHQRYFFLSDVRRWLREHPEFRERMVYPRKAPGRSCNPRGLRFAGAGTSGER